MIQLAALVQPISPAVLAERRLADRHDCTVEAVSRSVEGADPMWWGATVRDLSRTGLSLTLCFPFRTGAFLAVDLKEARGAGRTLLIRVVHAQDMADGTWRLGCEFVKPLTESDLELII